jgi:hypothetical protein
MNDHANWNGNTRRDGLHIMEGDAGFYIARLPNGWQTPLICPCCDKRAGNQIAARFIADQCFPEGGNDVH